MARLGNEKGVIVSESEEPDKYRIGLLREQKEQKTPISYPLHLTVSMIPGLSSGAKILFAVLRYRAFGGRFCKVGDRALARIMGVDRKQIRRWRRELEQRGLIKVTHDGWRTGYCLARIYTSGESIPMLAEVVEQKGIGWTHKLQKCLISYREGANDCTWEFQKQIAKDQGCSVRTTQRVLRAMKEARELQIRLRQRNRKQGNKYTLTLKAVHGGRIFGDNSHRTKCPHVNKKRSAKSCLDASRQRILKRDLSQAETKTEIWMEETYLELRSIRINEDEARWMAFDLGIPFESVAQAINNAYTLRASQCQSALKAGSQMPYFNVAGYVINATKAARRECKIIGTTKLFREAGKMYHKHRKAKTGGTQRKTMSAKAALRRKRKLVRQVELMMREEKKKAYKPGA